MGIEIEPSKCTGCGMCELVCGFHWDDAFSVNSACIVTYRMQEKRNYFGIMLKTEKDLIIGRPEGVEVQRLGGSSEEEPSADEEDEDVEVEAEVVVKKEEAEVEDDEKDDDDEKIDEEEKENGK